MGGATDKTLSSVGKNMSTVDCDMRTDSVHANVREAMFSMLAINTKETACHQLRRAS